MRSRSLPLLLALSLALPGGPLPAQDTRPGIAVLPITNAGSYGQAKEDFDALERGLAAMLVSELSANPAARVVEREQVQRLIDEQNLGASGRVSEETAARIGKLVGARYVVKGTFVDFYGDFRLDLHLVNVETSEIVKTVSEKMRRDHLFDIIKSAAQRLMKETNLPPLSQSTQQQRLSRQIPTEALTFYSKGLLYQDRGDRARAAEMFQKAIDIFPEYAEAREGLQRARSG
ncbi:MAG TPA: CsgG/HfaB family protein [Gemmatimonadales bacterium]|nr:CsgG/HfaB family protein [Gemmatimonadales bacterium]